MIRLDRRVNLPAAFSANHLSAPAFAQNRRREPLVVEPVFGQEHRRPTESGLRVSIV